MASSGTYSWTLDLAEVIEEAYERAGLTAETGYDMRTARRSLNLLLTEWSNRGVNLWRIDLVTQTLATDTQSYTLATNIVDVLDAVRRDTDGVDTPIYRMSLQEYLSERPEKANEGPVTHYVIERNSYGGHTMYTWPVTNDSTDKIIYWGVRYNEDVSATGGDQTIEVPKRFLPALIAGLAHQIALKKLPMDSEANIVKLQMLKADYEETLMRAMEEDRERSSFRVTPWIR